MYLLLAFANLCIACGIHPLIPSSHISNISLSVNNSIFTPVILKEASMLTLVQINNVQDLNYIFLHVSVKLSNISVSNKVSVGTYKS